MIANLANNIDIRGVITPSLILGDSARALLPRPRILLKGQLRLMKSCSTTMQTQGPQSLLLGVNGQHYTEGWRLLSNTCRELRGHVVSCTSCKQWASGAESWRAEAQKLAEHFQQPKHYSMINTRNVFISSYLEERTTRFWHAAWEYLTGRMSREAFPAVQHMNFGESSVCKSAMGTAVHDRPGEPMALALPGFKNFYHCQCPAQLSVRSVWKPKPTGHGWLLVYAWLMSCTSEAASQLAKQSLPANKSLTVLSLKHHQSRWAPSAKQSLKHSELCEQSKEHWKGAEGSGWTCSWPEAVGEIFSLWSDWDLEHHCHRPIVGCKEIESDRETLPLSCHSNPGAGDRCDAVFEGGNFGGQKQLCNMLPSSPCWLFVLFIAHPCTFILPPCSSQVLFSHPKTVHKPLGLHQNWWIREPIP